MASNGPPSYSRKSCPSSLSMPIASTPRSRSARTSSPRPEPTSSTRAPGRRCASTKRSVSRSAAAFMVSLRSPWTRKVASPSAPRLGTGSILRVLFGDEPEDLRAARRVEDRLAQLLLLEEPRDARQRLQVQARRILRREEHEEELRRLSVDGSE